jgi:hypothetical protein
MTLGRDMGATVPELDLDQATGAQAIDIAHEVLGDLFPAMKDGRSPSHA